MTTPASTITFSCSGCGKEFIVPASYVGRKATCKICGAPVVVPPASTTQTSSVPSTPEPESVSAEPTAPELPAQIDTPVEAPQPETLPTQEVPLIVAQAPEPLPPALEPPQPAPTHKPAQPDVPKVPVRIRRLLAEAQQMAEAFHDFPIIQIKSTVGDPPEIYQIEYKIKSLHRGWLGKPKPRENHLVEIQLTSDYPRMAPHCKMLTPIFHPNIDETTICVGDHWTAGERLVDLVIRIGEMIAYQAYNIKSPLDGEAAMWADLNGKLLPTDSRTIAPGPPPEADANE